MKRRFIRTGLSRLPLAGWTKNSLVVGLLFAIGSLHAFAQEVEVTASQTVTSYKLPTKDPTIGGIYLGSTLVDLEEGLQSISIGNEPKSVQELVALEKQQMKVADKIKLVTVNVMQGNAQGSGVIISPDGYVLTAAHVAGRPGRDAKLTLSDGRQVHGKTLGMNREVDAGLIKITDSSNTIWPHASIGKSESLHLGQWVIAAGHPGGLDTKRPPVIRVGRLLDNLASTLITDCTLIGGDSGGPLFDLTGKLIGIHSRIGSEFADNMHVPIDMYHHKGKDGQDTWQRMVKGESWGTLPGQSRPIIGVKGFETGDKSQEAVIQTLIEDGPAERAGLQPGDVITSFDGVEVKTFQELISAVEGSLPGDAVRIRFLRDGVQMERRIIVGANPN